MTISSAAEGDWLLDAVDRLVADKPTDLLDVLLPVVGPGTTLASTKTTVRTHFMALDAQGRPRTSALTRSLANQLIDYCIPRERVAEAQRHMRETRSSEKLVQLEREARKMFTSLDKSGEGGELLLYTLLERGLKIPQMLCKMSHKTSGQMHYHGADAIHVKVLPNDRLALYWGESKLHKSVSGAITDCFKSIAPFLIDDTGDIVERDLYLLRSHLDAGEQKISEELVRYFLDDSPESSRLEVRAACLVGFELMNYPNPWSPDGLEIVTRVKKQIDKWQGHIVGAIGAHKVESFEVEVFCVPMPSVDEFRKSIRRDLGIEK